jgi:ribosomal protein S27AE
VTRERRALALAQIVVAKIEADAPGERKLRRSHLRCAAEQQDDAIARELGVLELVEHARDTHLADLDADEGLAALCVPWQEVVAEAVGLLDRPRRTCPRCGARLSRRRPVCGRCRLPAGGRA